VLRQRFLELTQPELEQAKFFTEVYGMKKLVADTGEQKDRFIREIVLAYAKLKEELFLDYPRFQAMVKAKEFEYLEIIKELRESLGTVEARFKEVNDRQTKVDEELKQVTYENNKARNELRNKEALLEESNDKLRLITKKYNEQAEQAIQKAKAIMSKSSF
jgi:DNA repair exonuclease SbcCD ATPase subunit